MIEVITFRYMSAAMQSTMSRSLVQTRLVSHVLIVLVPKALWF